VKKAELAAVETVAAHFSAMWKEGPSGAYLAIAGKRVALAVAAVKPQIPAKQRLRFDKVALELLQRMRDGLQDSVPDGKTIVFTVTAPIRQSGKTAAELEEAVRRGLARRTLDIRETIQGNGIRARLVKGGNPKVVGFVHNPDPNSDVLLDLTQSLLGLVSALKGNEASWLVIADEGGRSHLDAYRYLAAQISGFKAIVFVSENGGVEILRQ
jgi:hypothetical protein